MNDQAEHRRYPRFPAKHTALLRTIDADAEGFGRTNAVSVGGCGVLTREEIPSGVAVELLMTIDRRVVQVVGRTVYTRPVEDGLTEVGVEFLDVAEEDVDLLRATLDAPASR